MPTFDFTSPDGKSYSVEGPDGATPEQAFQMLQQHIGTTQQPAITTGQDLKNAATYGLSHGATGLLGLGGDAGSLIGKGVDYLGGAAGISPDTMQTIKGVTKSALESNPITGGATALLNGPSSSDLQSKLESVTGPMTPAQTVPGQYLQTAAEFLPAAIGGPEGLATKLLTRVAVPALASETAGQLTKGTAAEPYARVAGALAGGVAGAKAIPSVATAAPTADELGAAAKAAYEHPTVAALELNPSSTAFQAGKIKDSLNKTGFRELNAPQTYGILDELKTPLGPTAKIADVQSVRTALGKVAGNFANPTEQAAASKAISGIDNYLANLKPFDVAKGDAQGAAAILNDAKGNYSAMKRATRFDDAEYRAELNTASAHSGGNINNATRQALKSILLSPSKSRGFNADELAQMEQVVKGTATGNVMRRVGKLLSTSGMHGGNVIAGSAVAAPFTHGASLALPAIGMAAKKIADMSTGKAVRALDEMIRSRSPLAAQVAAQNPQIVQKLPSYSAGLLSAMVAADPILSQQSAQPVR